MIRGGASESKARSQSPAKLESAACWSKLEFAGGKQEVGVGELSSKEMGILGGIVNRTSRSGGGVTFCCHNLFCHEKVVNNENHHLLTLNMLYSDIWKQMNKKQVGKNREIKYRYSTCTIEVFMITTLSHLHSQALMC